jgi:AraC-like DNA-binding protein
MRQSSVVTHPVGVEVRGAPLIGFRRLAGIAPVVVVRLPEHLDGEFRPRDDGAHAHDFLVLFYAHRAGGSFRLDGRTWTVQDGDLFVIAPGQVVSMDVADPTIVGWVVLFPADVIRPGNPGAYASWQAHPLLLPFARGVDRAQRLHVPGNQREAWVERIAALDAELRARRDGHHEAALAHLTLLLVALSRLSTDVAGDLRSADEPLLAAVFDVIERRYHEQLSLTDVAAAVALTPGHLTTVVRRKTGRTVQQWIAQRRMQEARLLLTDTTLTVAAVSRRVGYPDVSYFIKRFRADHDLTPARWRSAT